MLTQGPIPVQVLVSAVFVAFGRGANVAVCGSVGMTIGGIDVTAFAGIDPPAAVPQAVDAANRKETTKSRNTFRFVIVQYTGLAFTYLRA